MADDTVKNIINATVDWVQARINERTSWDGVSIIVVSILALIASPLVKYAAWFGLGYGAWTLWKRESNNKNPLN
jgi:hypothetical protein